LSALQPVPVHIIKRLFLLNPAFGTALDFTVANRFIMNRILSAFLKNFVLILVIISAAFCKAYGNGNVAVNTVNNKTSIVVTGFPKNATVLVVDEHLNLLSVGSTNHLGKAFIKINKAIKTTITVRTVQGDIQISYKMKSSEPGIENEMAGNKTNSSIKA
jgi:hypothetical protein